MNTHPPHAPQLIPTWPPRLPVPTASARVAPAELPYHRLGRLDLRSARWWRPLAVIGVAVPIYLLLVIVVMLAVMVPVMVIPGAPQPSSEFNDPRNPLDVGIMLSLLALLIPALLASVRVVGGRDTRRGTMHSVRGRLRWRLLMGLTSASFAAYTVVFWGAAVVFDRESLAMPPLTLSFAVLAVIVVLLVPLQAAAEEYVFRGLLPQALGTWLRSPIWAIVVPAVPFVLLHGYDWVGKIDVAVFAVCAGLLTWKTGGLEAAIALHTANNVTGFLQAAVTGGTLDQGAVPPEALLLTVPMTLLSTGGVWLWFSRHEHLRLTQPLLGDGSTRPSSATATVAR